MGRCVSRELIWDVGMGNRIRFEKIKIDLCFQHWLRTRKIKKTRSIYGFSSMEWSHGSAGRRTFARTNGSRVGASNRWDEFSIWCVSCLASQNQNRSGTALRNSIRCNDRNASKWHWTNPNITWSAKRWITTICKCISTNLLQGKVVYHCSSYILEKHVNLYRIGFIKGSTTINKRSTYKYSVFEKGIEQNLFVKTRLLGFINKFCCLCTRVIICSKRRTTFLSIFKKNELKLWRQNSTRPSTFLRDETSIYSCAALRTIKKDIKVV
eukprot:g4651.t1